MYEYISGEEEKGEEEEVSAAGGRPYSEPGQIPKKYESIQASLGQLFLLLLLPHKNLFKQCYS